MHSRERVTVAFKLKEKGSPSLSLCDNRSRFMLCLANGLLPEPNGRPRYRLKECAATIAAPGIENGGEDIWSSTSLRLTPAFVRESKPPGRPGARGGMLCTGLKHGSGERSEAPGGPLSLQLMLHALH